MQLNIKYPGLLSVKAFCKMMETANYVEKARNTRADRGYGFDDVIIK